VDLISSVRARSSPVSKEKFPTEMVDDSQIGHRLGSLWPGIDCSNPQAGASFEDLILQSYLI